MCGKYVDLSDSYKSLNEALRHAGIHNHARVKIEYVDSEDADADERRQPGRASTRSWCPAASASAASKARSWPRSSRARTSIPYLGICLGMQVATIEYARHMAGPRRTPTAPSSTPRPPHPVIALIDEWQDRDGSIQKRNAQSDLGGTMRLGAQSSDVKPGTLAHEIYGNVVTERHRHRYEANENYLDRLRRGRPGDLGDHPAREADRDRRAAAGACTPGSSACSSTPSSSRTPWDGHPLFNRSSTPRCEHQAAAQPRRSPRERRRVRMKLCGFDVGLDQPFFLIAGPCVVESEQLQLDVAGQLKEITAALGIPFIFKSSYDKANRSSGTSFRGPGMDKGLEILAKVKRELGVPVLTDVHTRSRDRRRGRGRRRAADAGVPVPPDRLHPRRGAERQAGQHQEGPVPRAARHEERDRQGARRGAREGPAGRQLHGLRARRELRLQQPGVRHALAGDHARDRRAGGLRRHPLGAAARRPGHVSRGGQREFVPVLARAAVAVGVAGLFMETHPDPARRSPTARTRCR